MGKTPRAESRGIIKILPIRLLILVNHNDANLQIRLQTHVDLENSPRHRGLEATAIVKDNFVKREMAVFLPIRPIRPE